MDNFVSQIDLNNTNGILQYGAGAQKKMADFSEQDPGERAEQGTWAKSAICWQE